MKIIRTDAEIANKYFAVLTKSNTFGSLIAAFFL